jgi:hypothetical protein
MPGIGQLAATVISEIDTDIRASFRNDVYLACWTRPVSAIHEYGIDGHTC